MTVRDRSTATTEATTDAPATMRAIVQDRYGEAHDVLYRAEVPVPEPADDEVRIRVQAVGVDRAVWHLMAGIPYLVRPAFGLRRPRRRIRGREVAGTVDAVGRAVTDLAVGDEVFGMIEEAFAEYAVGSPAKLRRLPAGASFVEAAALPVSGTTALQAIRDKADVLPGDRVLVVGASGGVGNYCVQLAKAAGAEVTGVCQGSKADFVRSAGADHVIDHTTTRLGDLDERFDVIIDIGGNRPLRELRGLMTERGRLVLAGGEDGGRWFGMQRQLWAVLLSLAVRQKLVMLVASERGEDLEALSALVESGEVRALVERTFTLTEAAEAVQHLQDGQVRGKVVVTVD